MASPCLEIQVLYTYTYNAPLTYLRTYVYTTGALLCGQKQMVEDVKKQMLEAGVFEGRVLLNF